MEDKNKECPYCKENIKLDATKCKHCSSALPNKKPSHEGTCTYCKEEIHPEAILCKHCNSPLNIVVECSSDSHKTNVGMMNFNPSNNFFGGSPGFIGGQRCINVMVPICDWVEDVDEIAGFKNGRWANCRWEWRKICTPTWW